MSRILITGAAGFIGFHTSLFLLRENYQIIALDNLSRGKKEFLSAIEKEGGETIVGDVRDKKTIEKLISKVDAIVHLAALISVEESFEKPELYMDVNGLGTTIIAKSSLEHSLEKIVYASSAAVYGMPKHLPIKEDHPKNPQSPYGVTKYVGEQIITSLYNETEANYVILRFFNVYGPGQEPNNPYSGVISKFVNNIIQGKPPIIFGDGQQTRDFIFVEDVAESISRALKYKGKGVFNIGTGREVSIIELVDIIKKIVNKDVKPVFHAPRKGDIRRSVADTRMAKDILGFEAKTSIFEGIHKYVSAIKGLNNRI